MCQELLLKHGLGVTDTHEKPLKNASAIGVVSVLERSVFLSFFNFFF